MYCPSAEFVKNQNPNYQLPKINTLNCWDIISSEPNFLLLHNRQAQGDWSEFSYLVDCHEWKDVPDVTPYLLFDKYAVVITDLQGIVVWVSKGFETMTGYAKAETLNRSPKFLQGEETSWVTSQNIAQKLKNYEKTTATVINYRKSGEKYNCELQIFPMFTTNNRPSHFLALEKEV
jgi:PAS domain S-box-containing protein